MDKIPGICAGCGSDIGGATLCQPCRDRLMRLEPSYQSRRNNNEQEDEMADLDNQKKKILRHLRTFGSIDPIQALQEYGILRLAARINDLRQEYEIDTHLVSTINRFGEPVRYARYVLANLAA
jgi:hypothetical protein